MGTMAAAAARSQLPAQLLGLTGLVGVVVLFAGWRLSRRARLRTDPASLFAVLAVVAVGAALVIATGLGFRHYGGHSPYDHAYSCDAWWRQLGSPHGVAEGDGSAWPMCKRAARDAVVPGVAEAVIGGLVVGLVAAGIVVLRRRRLTAHLRDLASPSTRP